MTPFDYTVSLIALLLYYFIGRVITVRISPKNYKSLFLKYYNIGFFLSIITIIIVHIAFVLDGNLDGMPSALDAGNDAVRYVLSAKAMINDGVYTNAFIRYGTSGGYVYVFLLAGIFKIFGINILAGILLNALLYGLSVVLVGKFASFYFNKSNIKRSMIFFILFFPFLSYTSIPLKETLVYILSLAVLINIEKLKYQRNSTGIILLLFFVFLLFFTRVYVGVILFVSAVLVLFVKANAKHIIISVIILGLGMFLFMNINIMGFGFSNLYDSANFNIGVWKQEENINVTGADAAINVVVSGKLNYLNLLYNQSINLFFRPFFTSYPRIEESLSSGTYIRSILWYLGSFTWYVLLPSAVYGLFHMIKNRRDMLIFYLPVILFFLLFLFVSNQMRYQFIIRLFLIFVSVYGFQFYSKWKKYIPIWIIIYIVIAVITF